MVVGAASSGFFRVLGGGICRAEVSEEVRGPGVQEKGNVAGREGEWMSCSQVSVPSSHSEGLFKRGVSGLG